MRFFSLLVIFFVLQMMVTAQEDEASFFRLQKSGRPLMKGFMSRFPYHNPMFTLREQGGRPKPFSGF